MEVAEEQQSQPLGSVLFYLLTHLNLLLCTIPPFLGLFLNGFLRPGAPSVSYITWVSPSWT